MKTLAIVVAGLALALPGCNSVPPGTSLQNHFHTSLPQDIKVVHYYSDSYKDPQFLWVMTPIKEDFLKQLVTNGRLKALPREQTTPSPTSPGLAPWWNSEQIEKIPEVYSRDPDPTDGSYYRIWVDREHNRLYVLFMNT